MPTTWPASTRQTDMERRAAGGEQCATRQQARRPAPKHAAGEIARSCRAAAERCGHSLEIEYLVAGFEFRVLERGGSRTTETYRLEDLAWLDCCLTFGVSVPEVDVNALETALLRLLECPDNSRHCH